MEEPSLIDIWNRRVHECLEDLRRSSPEHKDKSDQDLLSDRELCLRHALTLDHLANGNKEKLQDAMLMAVGLMHNARDILQPCRMFDQYTRCREPLSFYVSLGHHPELVSRCLQEIEERSATGKSYGK